MKKTILSFPFVLLALSSFCQNIINTEEIQVIEEPKVTRIPAEEQIFTVVEHMPEYNGGEAALQSFLAENLQYPEVDKKNSIEGKVYVKFMVDELGNISQIYILRSPSISIANETVRVIKMIPPWKPGIHGGKSVKVWFSLPIDFKLK